MSTPTTPTNAPDWIDEIADDIHTRVIEPEDAAKILRAVYARGRSEAFEQAAKEAESWFDHFDFASFKIDDLRRLANPNQIAERIRHLAAKDPAHE